MATYEINYKSDFTLVMGFTLAGVAVPLPVGNFRIVFRTQEYGTEYECSRINGEYVNCQDNGNDTLLCIFDRHGLRPGALRGEVFDYIPDNTYPDGSQLVVTPSLFDIELVEGAGNTSEGVTAEVIISVEEVVGQARDAALAAENAAESANAAADSASDAADRANDAADAATEAIAGLDDRLAAKQDTLVSGVNIKTINNLSLLGSGNITIQGGGGEQVQSDWAETDSSNPAYIKNKPTLATVATSGSYNDLSDKPSIREAIIGMIDANEDFYRLIGYNQLGRPSYNPIKDTPSNIYFYIDLPTGKMYRYYDGSDWAVGDSHWKPFLATVATSGSYADLSNKPDMSQYAALHGSSSEYFAASKFHATATNLDSSIQLGADGIDRLINIQTNPQQVNLTFPDKAGTLAVMSDVRRVYVNNSADASVELSVTTYNDLGTLSAWKTITLPASYDRADEFVFRFVCNDASLTPTLPSGVVMADNFEWSEMAVGVVFQVSICDGIAAYLVLTPNS